MKDIPVFTTEYGVASLVLSEVTCKKQAYVRLQDTRTPGELVSECVKFCKAVGAEQVFATGHPYLETYPLYTAVCRMERSTQGLPETTGYTVPVTQETFEKWRRQFNERMAAVPGAATVTMRDTDRLLSEGGCYYVCQDGRVIGLGKINKGKLEAVASLEKGGGRDTLLALCANLGSATVSLEVACNNAAALRLYRCLGFVQTEELLRWYQVGD